MSKYKNKIEILVRAIIQNNGKVLVCRKIGKRYYFFPGGHITFGENIKQALAREIKEELGLFIKDYSFIGALENIYIEDLEKHHEIILVFEVKVDNLKLQSKENHLEFFLKDEKEFIKEKVLPATLKRAVLKWLKDKKPFWVNEINKKI